jgi:hypothetical protein
MLGRGIVLAPSQRMVAKDCSPADRYEIHVAMRLRNEGVTLRIQEVDYICHIRGDHR